MQKHGYMNKDTRTPLVHILTRQRVFLCINLLRISPICCMLMMRSFLRLENVRGKELWPGTSPFRAIVSKNAFLRLFPPST
jgi:hypothetical protein